MQWHYSIMVSITICDTNMFTTYRYMVSMRKLITYTIKFLNTKFLQKKKKNMNINACNLSYS